MTTATIVPFWNRLRDISLYPFRDAAKYSLIVLALGLFLLGWLPILGALFWAAAFKYAFEILLASANGKLKSPEIVLGVDNHVVGRYIALQTLSVAVPLAIAGAGAPVLGIVLFILFTLAQPAAIMGLALTQSLRRALNPGLWFAVMNRVGWPYLALFGLMLVMQLSAANASGLVAEVLPGFMVRAIAIVFSLWSLFATFHLMGYLVYQYHEEFGFEPSILKEEATLPFNRDRELLENASAKLQAGEAAAAAQLLREELRSRAVSAEVHELYRRLLKQQGDRAALIDHGRSYLHLLMIEKQPAKALVVARECFELDPNFSAMDNEHNVQLAERAVFAGQSRLAIDLLLAAWQREPEHHAAVTWVLRAVELLTRQSGRESEARQLLQTARQRCQDPDLLARIDANLAAIPA